MQFCKKIHSRRQRMRIAICDDDKLQRETLEQYVTEHISAYPNIKITKYSSGEKLLDALRSYKIDILLLDIEMGGINGIETAKKIREFNSEIIIIFITGYVNYVSDAFRTNAFQFLIKPVKQELFDQEFERAIKKYQNDHHKYVIVQKSGTISLEINEIIFLESEGRKINIHTKNKLHTKYGTINDEENTLLNYGFVRCHQAFLVNMKYILEIEKNDIVLKNGIKIMISVRKRSEVVTKFNKYLAGLTT